MADTGDWRTCVDMKGGQASSSGQHASLAERRADGEGRRLQKNGGCRASDGGSN